MNEEIALGIARHGLTIAGGMLVQKGYASADDVQGGLGAVVTLIGVGLSVWHKIEAKRKAAAAAAAPAPVKP
jgi:hypothetical protein